MYLIEFEKNLKNDKQSVGVIKRAEYKNGVRQMLLDEFMEKEFIKNLKI